MPTTGATNVIKAPGTTNVPGWRPILETDDEALRAVVGIEQDLSSRGELLVYESSLSRGSAGVAILYAYLAQGTANPYYAEQAETWLQRSLASAVREDLSTALYGGLTGLGWALAHLSSPDDRVDDEQFSLVDEHVNERLAQADPREEYDLINGLVGLGVYALERLPSPTAVSFLERIVERLAGQAEYLSSGITWLTPPGRTPAQPPAQPDDFHVNLGVAHGVPGVIGFLAQTALHGIAAGKSRALLDGAVPWLLKQRLAPGGVARFAYSTPSHRPMAPARLAWCYGDLGIAPVLLAAGQATGNNAWRAAAIELSLTAAERSLDTSGVQDAGLCHGAAGAGHLFNRLYQSTGEPRLLAAARRWFDDTLAMARADSGVGGFSSVRPLGQGQAERVDDPGLLEGAVGVALALLAAGTSITPQWDRMLLCSLPAVLSGP